MSNNELLERALTSVGLAEGQHFWLKAGTALDQCFGNRLRIGESYVNGLWGCGSLPVFFNSLLSDPKALFRVLGPAAERGQVRQSAEETAAHYNFGNDWYERMLGKSMVYTCGIWYPKCRNLENAQRRKVEKLSMKLGVKKGGRVLDIGGGFGSLAYHLAKTYDIEVHVITISKQQMEYGQTLCEGLPVQFHLLDYRDMTLDHFDGKPFDAVVTVEMMEHVGLPEQHVVFHKKIADVLRPGGTLVHQVITTTKPVVDEWLDKYIFPGGVLLTLDEIKNVSGEAGFTVYDTEELGEHYPPTLLAWRDNLFRHKAELMQRGYKEEHFRMFDYYLSLCSVLFQTKLINLHQVVLCKQ